MKIEDIKNAVSYIRSLKMTAQDKIGLIGVCAGAGYSTAAAAFDARIKAAATATGRRKTPCIFCQSFKSLIKALLHKPF